MLYEAHPSWKSYLVIARSVARRSSQNLIFAEEDIYQELIEHLIRKWDYVHSDDSQTERERCSLVKAIFANKVKDLVSYYSTRPDMSQYSHESMNREENEEAFGDYDCDEQQITLSESSRFDTPEESLRGRELLNLLVELRDTHSDSDVVEFLDTIISEEGRNRVENLNEEYESSCVKQDRRDYLTPFRRAKLLGKASSFPYRMMHIVRHFLLSRNVPLSREIMAS